jgi:hypothetical protein
MAGTWGPHFHAPNPLRIAVSGALIPHVKLRYQGLKLCEKLRMSSRNAFVRRKPSEMHRLALNIAVFHHFDVT